MLCHADKESCIGLIEDPQALNEVILVGYGTMKKNDLTGSVVRAKIDRFERNSKYE